MEKAGVASRVVLQLRDSVGGRTGKIPTATCKEVLLVMLGPSWLFHCKTCMHGFGLCHPRNPAWPLETT